MMTIQDVYREGAYKGVPMGIYLSVLSVLSMMTDSYPSISLVAWPMILLVPVVHWLLLYIVYARYKGGATFSQIWMTGITEFFGASLICALITYAYLQYCDPDFFYRIVTSLAKTLEGDPQMSELSKSLKIVIDGGLVPTNIEYCGQMMMFTVFSGSVLTIVLIPLVKLRYRLRHN